MRTIVLIAPFILLTFSCKKVTHDVQNPASTNAATIDIISPYEDQVFSKGDTVRMGATINSEHHMHGCEVYITADNGDTLYKSMEHSHGMQIHVKKQWINTLSTPADLQLIFVAIIDHEGVSSEKRCAIKAL